MYVTGISQDGAITMSDILPHIINTCFCQELSKMDVKQYFETQNLPKEGKRDVCRSLTFPTLPLE